jgi:hypothetical protein
MPKQEWLSRWIISPASRRLRALSISSQDRTRQRADDKAPSCNHPVDKQKIDGCQRCRISFIAFFPNAG